MKQIRAELDTFFTCCLDITNTKIDTSKSHYNDDDDDDDDDCHNDDDDDSESQRVCDCFSRPGHRAQAQARRRAARCTPSP